MKKKVLPLSSRVALSKVLLSGSLLGSGLLMAGVLPASAQPTGGNKPRVTSPATTPKPVPSVAITNVAVAAEVGGEKILMQDVNRLVDGVVQEHPQLAESTPDAQENLKKLREDILENMISQRLLLQEAIRLNKVPTPAQVDEAVWDFKKSFNTPADYSKWLTDEGKTEADLRTLLSNRMATEAVKKSYIADVSVNDADISKYYEEHKAEFVIPDAVQVRHIQFSFTKDMTDKQKSDLRKKAEGVLKKATAADANFNALAKANSDDNVSAVEGGNLGLLTREDIIDPVFAEAVFSTPAGKVNPKLLETKFGYNIIKVEEKKAGRTLSLAEATTYIKPLLLQEKAKTTLDTKVAELRAKANVKKNI
jgi:parvulin-like peptidyl-prolyl isomerase